MMAFSLKSNTYYIKYKYCFSFMRSHLAEFEYIIANIVYCNSLISSFCHFKLASCGVWLIQIHTSIQSTQFFIYEICTNSIILTVIFISDSTVELLVMQLYRWGMLYVDLCHVQTVSEKNNAVHACFCPGMTTTCLSPDWLLGKDTHTQFHSLHYFFPSIYPHFPLSLFRNRGMLQAGSGRRTDRHRPLKEQYCEVTFFPNTSGSQVSSCRNYPMNHTHCDAYSKMRTWKGIRYG